MNEKELRNRLKGIQANEDVEQTVIKTKNKNSDSNGITKSGRPKLKMVKWTCEFCHKEFQSAGEPIDEACSKCMADIARKGPDLNATTIRRRNRRLQ